MVKSSSDMSEYESESGFMLHPTSSLDGGTHVGLEAGLPDGRDHGHFPEKWPF